MTIWKESYIMVLIHQVIRDKEKQTPSLKPFKVTNENVEISLQAHQGVHPRRNIYEEMNLSRMLQSTHPWRTSHEDMIVIPM